MDIDGSPRSDASSLLGSSPGSIRFDRLPDPRGRRLSLRIDDEPVRSPNYPPVAQSRFEDPMDVATPIVEPRRPTFTLARIETARPPTSDLGLDTPTVEMLDGSDIAWLRARRKSRGEAAA